MLRKNYILDLLSKVKTLKPFTVVSVIGLIALLYPGEDSLFSLLEYSSQLKSMTKEKEQLKVKIEEDRQKLDQLRFKKEKLEKYARERFLMKAEDEDLYIIEE